MTILPKRNKRRFEEREDTTKHGVGPSNPDISTLNHQLQVQVDSPRHPNPHTHGHSHSLAQSGHASGHSALLQGHSRYNQANVYHNLLHRPENSHSKSSTSDGPSSSKWKRSPPLLRCGKGEDHVLAKKSKRAHSKSKHRHHKPLENSIYSHNVSQQANTPFVALLPKVTTASGVVPTNKQSLIPPTSSMASLLSPKMPGGAQDTFGKTRKAAINDGQASSEDECKSSPPSPGGCNSEDEHMPSLEQTRHSEELETNFELALKKELGLDIKQMEMDGSCLFRAIADQVYGDQDMHDVVRNHCIDYMAKNRDHFSHYVTEDFSTYLQRKRQLGCHGNHVEMQALSEMYNRPIEVYQYSLKPINIFHSSYNAESAFPIRLSYHRNTHYNSLVDPDKPTIGVGLGLPGFKPRMVEENLLSEVKAHSENYQLEQTMLNDKLRETDWELTDDAIQEQVARESYLQWLEDCQKRTRRAPACTVTGPSCSSGAEGKEDRAAGNTLASNTHSSHEPEPRKPRSASKSGASSSTPTLSSSQASSSSAASQAADNPSAALPQMNALSVYGYNGDVDENDAVARAIAESQQDYIQHIMKSKK